jgi:hypothetical protein
VHWPALDGNCGKIAVGSARQLDAITSLVNAQRVLTLRKFVQGNMNIFLYKA